MQYRNGLAPTLNKMPTIRFTRTRSFKPEVCGKELWSKMALTFIPTYVWEPWRERRSHDRSSSYCSRTVWRSRWPCPPRGSSRDVRGTRCCVHFCSPFTWRCYVEGPPRGSYRIEAWGKQQVPLSSIRRWGNRERGPGDNSLTMTAPHSTIR